MTVNDYKKRFLNQLPAFYDETERLNLFYMTMEFVLNYNKADVVLNGNESVLIENQQKIDEVFNRLQDNEPIQYITQQANFFGFDFKVSPATLIPRPETEELVDWVLTEMKKQPQKNWRVLDIGTGTGCIPITIKKEFPLAEVFAIDISVEALKIAQQNAINLKANVTFIQQDILQTEQLDAYDIIISNPPYIRNLEKAEINENVLQHEPHLALFVDDNDPLVFYRKISQLAYKSLTENGMLFFEINQYLGNEMLEMVSAYFKTIELKKDFIQNDRMMKAY
ncbi:peptide chain release factor N(5)-glutamine methyltransferase [Flavobacterium sp. CBA20B-1]|uniref:peptide chain release factor N(5)-glutamine methyltransferase n=1 Tax=unclassified Flavobacterium TaxID=196869 RepID=UPI002224ABC6|nr:MULTISPECIES: peptide chain release factor N(5)-glutamine methyltransferase [unclassified Flavobacterium]WCM43082.1 peptide chain release factor N(5)-glutamine methyltransferase [Flavobacterium sp. CBA20B-1]